MGDVPAISYALRSDTSHGVYMSHSVPRYMEIFGYKVSIFAFTLSLFDLLVT